MAGQSNYVPEADVRRLAWFSPDAVQRAAQRSGATDPQRLFMVLRDAGIARFKDTAANGRPPDRRNSPSAFHECRPSRCWR